MSINTQAAMPDFDKLWDFNKAAETEVKFRELLPKAQNPEFLDYKLQLLTQIARTQGLQKKFEEAHKTLDEVKNSLTKQTTIAEIRMHLERGRIFNSSQKKDLALPEFHKSFELALHKKKENLTVDAAHMIALAETTPEKQMEWNLKAVTLAEKAKDPKAQKWLGSLYNNIGFTYLDSGKFENALHMFEKALKFREKQHDASAIRVAKWCIARAKRSLNKIEDAIKIQLALEKEFQSLPEKDGYVFEELGELYLLKKAESEYKKYFALAYAELSKDEFLQANEVARLSRIRQLSGTQ